MVLKVATVFSGIGAIEHALERMGIENEIKFACDNSNIDWAEKLTKTKKMLILLEKLENKGCSFDGIENLTRCWNPKCNSQSTDLLQLQLVKSENQKENILNVDVEKVEDLGNYKLLTAKMGNLTIKSKINRETEVPSTNVKLHIPAEKCCVYENEKLI